MPTEVTNKIFKAIGKDYIVYEASNLNTAANVWLSLKTLYNALPNIAADKNQQLMINPHYDDLGDHIIYFSGVSDGSPLELKYISLRKDNDVIKLKPNDSPFGWTDKRFRDIEFRSNAANFSVKIYVYVNWTNIRLDQYGRDTYFNSKDISGNVIEVAPPLYKITGQKDVAPTPIEYGPLGNNSDYLTSIQKDPVVVSNPKEGTLGYEDINW